MFYLFIYYKYIDIIFGLCSWILLEPVLDQQLVIWDPFETASEPILFSGFLFIFQGVPASGCFLFFGFWKQRNFFDFLCFLEAFLEMWRDPGTPADSYYQVRPECTDVPKTRFKIKVRFLFKFYMTYILFGFLDTLLDFLDIYAYTHTHTYIYTWHELRKVEISKW